jgi:hypothetical protein
MSTRVLKWTIVLCSGGAVLCAAAILLEFVLISGAVAASVVIVGALLMIPPESISAKANLPAAFAVPPALFVLFSTAAVCSAVAWLRRRRVRATGDDGNLL